jgi:3-oxoadipate enol-lactonase
MTDIKTERIGPAPMICVDHAGQGELLVFMHGIGGNRTNWRDQLPVFAGHFHAVAWDARGYGGSDDYDGLLDFSDFARDLARVLDHFGAARAHLAGLSMGGRIAMDFAEKYPDRLLTLTLIDTHPGFANLSEEKKVEFIRLRKEPLVNGKEPKDIAVPVARPLLGPNASPAAFQRLVDSMAALHKESYIKSIEATVRTEPQQRLHEIAVPTHVMVGAEDRLTPPSIARDLVAQIPGARLTIIEDAGHLVNIEQPDAFNDAALTFLLEHRALAAAR